MKEVAIIGAGASGVAAALLARAKGAKVYVSDLRVDASATAGADRVRAVGADVELGRHDVDRIARADAVVVSPGIPPGAEVLRALAERGVRWISEPEFAVRFFQGPLIAVTGTNGKTTTTALTGHLLRSAGIDAVVGGNIGAALGPAASELALREPPPAWYVVEMSSFQLADIDTFRPDIGVLTNLAPDHLDRYPSVDAYYADKARIFENADASSRWVLNGDDEAVIDLAGDAPGERYLFSLTRTDTAARLESGRLVLDVGGSTQSLVRIEALPLLGAHNVANALAASLAAHLAGAPADALAEGLRTAHALPHRLEPVADRDGLLWVNDSKATNVAATVSALKSLADRSVVVLLGGKDKGEDLAPLADALGDAFVGAHGGSVRTTVVYGAAGDRIAAALEGRVPVRRVREGFDAAVAAARSETRPGDLVLLSPACSSFDEFANYEERGRRFAALARGEA